MKGKKEYQPHSMACRLQTDPDNSQRDFWKDERIHLSLP
jgi:hypothetical protein